MAHGDGLVGRHSGALYVDIADLSAFLATHGIASGIQRVVVEVLKRMTDDLSVAPIVYSRHTRRFHTSEPQDVADLLAALDESRTVDVKTVASRIRRTAADHPEVTEWSGGVLLVLGAAWNLPGLYHAVAVAKRQGCKVVNLVFDLIPGFDPSFPLPLGELFRVYVEQVARVADRVPCISRATRADFVEYTQRMGLPTPPGEITQLPGGLDVSLQSGNAVQGRPYVLMVGTIEGRKEHVTAFRAWRILRDSLPADSVPRLLIVGRWGWNVHAFVDAMVDDPRTAELLDIRADYVNDRELADMYRGSLFTIYPSRKEGWGLPVSESLDFGKVPITTNTSSLPEAGGVWAEFVAPGSPSELAAAATRLLLDEDYRAAREEQIRGNRSSVTWDDVASVLVEEAHAALVGVGVDPWLRPELGIEYPVCAFVQIDVGHAARRYLRALKDGRTMPLTGAVGSTSRYAQAMLMCESEGSRITHQGMELPRSRDVARRIRFEFARPSEDALTLYLAVVTRGKLTASVCVNGARSRVSAPRGTAVCVDLGAGPIGEHVTVDVDIDGRRRPATLVSLLVGRTGVTSVLSHSVKPPRGMRKLQAQRSAAKTRGDILNILSEPALWRHARPAILAYRATKWLLARRR